MNSPLQQQLIPPTIGVVTLSVDKVLRHFIGPAQLSVMGDACRGEEAEWFKAKMIDMANLILSMPATYGTEGQEDPTAYLHYFKGGCDWYITEKDSDPDGEGQIQAYGLANIGYGAESGYICLPEILEAGAELDLHFEPRPVSQLKE